MAFALNNLTKVDMPLNKETKPSWLDVFLGLGASVFLFSKKKYLNEFKSENIFQIFFTNVAPLWVRL